MQWVKPAGLRPVRIWLFLVAAMIVGMIVLGGLTRLTESGLSMVEWKVFMGVVPPLSETDWQSTFEKYQQFPQYQKHFTEMTLDEFKFIFFMEYTHRLLGRLIGLVFFLPFLFFCLKKWLYAPFLRRCLLLFGLGGLQGIVGWIMVKSGLVDMPRVSHFRLTLHLGLALFVLAMTLWYAYRLTFSVREADAGDIGRMGNRAWWLVGLLSVQILSGGMVAGIRAGHAFNTWPTMNGEWIPGGLWSYDSLSQNLLENPVMLQFFHRWWAMAVVVFAVFFAVKFWHRSQSRLMFHARWGLIALVVLQVLLGIGTLVMRVPVSLASLHQLGAVLLLVVAILFGQQSFDAARINTVPRPSQGSA